jgi:spore coat protein U-like protein
MKRIAHVLATSAIAALALLAPAAYAETNSANIGMTATVVEACSITAEAMDFGTYDVTNPQALNDTSNLAVTCTGGSTAQISLASGPARQLAHVSVAGAVLAYELYSDSTRNDVWTDAETTPLNFASRSTQTVTVYGSVLAAQNLDNLPAGVYTGSVTATVTF